MILAQTQFESLINHDKELTDLEGVHAAWFDHFDDTLIHVVYAYKGICFDIVLKVIDTYTLEVIEFILAK